MSHTDIATNRSAAKWSRKDQAKRVLWGLAIPLFRLSPRPLWGWRRAMLRCFGAQVGRDVHIFPSVRVTMPWNLTLGDQCAIGDRVILYALGPVAIGARATVSQGAHLCAGSHDWRDPAMPLLKLPITVGDDVWICADAFVGPNVQVNDRAIVAARSVVMKDVPADMIVGGNPAQPIKTAERFTASQA